MTEDSNIKIGQDSVKAENAFPETQLGELAALDSRLSSLEADYYSTVDGSRGAGYGRSTQMSPNYKQGSSGWIIKENGDVEFNSGTFRGALIAGSIDIPDQTSASSFHVDSQGNAWWGTSFATGYATAPAYILNDGSAKFSNVTVTGTSTIGGRLATTIGSAINSGGDFINDLINSRLDTSSQEILQDFDFGTTNFAGAVKAGNITWSSSTGAITGGSGVVVYRKGIVGAAGGVATFTIDATTGDATFTGTLASTNTLTGSIVMPSGGFIRAGQTAYNTGTGFYLGNDSGTPRFSIGNSAGNRFTWDGSDLFLGLTTNGGITLRMPSGSATSSSGLIIQNSVGTGVLKINNNAFITTFGRPFAAASNTTGTFGSDWFNFFCENDLGNATGVIELPSTNRMLIKRSGGGAIVRIRATSNQTGGIDLFEPLELAFRSSVPGASGSYIGNVYYDTSKSSLVFASNTGWYVVSATPY